MSARFIAAIVGAVGGLVIGATLVAPQLTPALNAARNAAQKTSDDETKIPEPTIPLASGYGLETTVWRVTSALPRSMPVLSVIADGLERDLSRLSSGTLQVTVSEPGHLVPLDETLAAVQSGAIDAVIASPGLDRIGISQEHHSAIALFAGHPFGPGPLEMLTWLQSGGGAERLNTLLQPSGIHAVPCGLSATVSGGWFVKPLQESQGFQDQTIGAAGFDAMVLEQLGATPTQLNNQETTLTLAAGELDGTVMASPYIGTKPEFEKYANTLYFPAWQRPASVSILAMNADRWAALPTDDQSAVIGLCRSLMLTTLGQSEASQFDALKALMARGVDVRTYSENHLTALRQSWATVTDNLIDDDRSFRLVWAELQAFRETYAIWNDIRTGDGTFENQ